MKSTQSFNYFNKNDFNAILTTQEMLPFILDKRIFVDEALSTDVCKNLTSSRQLAKSLGFRFTWHSKGDILIRMEEGSRAHVAKSAADLDTIAKAY